MEGEDGKEAVPAPGAGATDDEGELDSEDDEEELIRARVKEIMKNPKEKERYRYFRRSRIKPETVMKQLRPSFASSEVPEEVGIILATGAKAFIGELVEEARELMLLANASGPVTPAFIRTAYQRRLASGQLPYATRAPIRK